MYFALGMLAQTKQRPYITLFLLSAAAIEPSKDDKEEGNTK
jgi:hypothetical protein